MNALKLETCTHQHLLELDQSNGYTAVANEVMFHVISNPVIASAARFWILVRFQQSGFYDREYIERTVSWFAKKLNVSVSTIQKWQRLLEAEGYMEILEQKYSSRNNKPNRYRACLPKPIADELKQSKDVYTEYTSFSESNPKSINEKNKQNKVITPSKTNGTIRIKSTVLQPVFEKAPDWLRQMIPGLVFEIIENRLWITGLHKIACTHLLEFEKQIIDKLNDKGYTIDHILYNRDTPASISSEKQTPNNRAKTNQENNGNTKIFNHTQHRILKLIQLTSIDGSQIQPSQAKQLCKEVIFAIDNGSLKNLSTNFAINVAIKLIRENRWRTPSGYTQPGSKN